MTCWCSSVLLVSALESLEAREELLRVQLSTGQGQGSLVAMICQKVCMCAINRTDSFSVTGTRPDARAAEAVRTTLSAVCVGA